MEWQPIETAPKERWPYVDLWMVIHPSPRSMGIGDEFRVVECWFQDGMWGHSYRGKFEPLRQECITHWMPLPEPPSAA